MSPKYAYTPRFRGALLALLATLFLAGCMSEDDKRGNVELDNAQVGSGEVFHGAEWATIKNLDPRKEECADCHGKNNDMSPYNSGFMAHNVGLQKNDTPESLGLANLKITSVNIKPGVDEGIVEVNLSEPMPVDANFNLVFAKLTPRVRHSRGHDWQNYLNAPNARSANDPDVVIPVGVSPQRAQGDFVSVDATRLSFDLKEGYGWGEHSFTVTDENGVTHQYSGIVGTKVVIEGLSEHRYCHEADPLANQTETDAGEKLICWWPDGTHLPAGVFVGDDDHFYVSFDEGYTHRVGLALRGATPAFNTWFDFIPNQPEVVIDEQWHKEYNDKFLAIGWGSNTQAENAVFQQEPASREIVDIQSCNSCHDSLTRHGDRSETQLCVTCHNPGNLEPRSGRSVDLKQLVHRIHRGTNLPTLASDFVKERDDIAQKTNAKGGMGLLAKLATDWTKVRFPQGPTPGDAAGITNCVKCHMGPDTQALVSGFAEELGAGGDVQADLKLAKVTPQGDNWLGVRSIEACRACHDSVIWQNSDMEAAVPLYGHKYLDVGYDFVGRQNNAGQHRNQELTAQFTCGTAGGCHGNSKYDSLDPSTIGVKPGGTPPIQSAHLKLTRDYLLAKRFSVDFVEEPQVSESGELTALVSVLDRGDLLFLNEGDMSVNVNLGNGAEDVNLRFTGRLGWMRDSPDYNHSAGTGIPGNPVTVSASEEDGYIRLTADIAGARDGKEWEAIRQDLSKVVGSLFVGLRIGDYTMESEVKDFRFDGAPLAPGEGRRKVVDFLAGSGVGQADTVTGWDKEHGANTQSCSSCHLQLPYHFNANNNVQACVICHNPQRTDLSSRGRSAENGMIPLGEDGQYEESLDFKRLIHAVHAAGDGFRKDPFYVGTSGNARPSISADGEVLAESVRGNSFPGVLDNCMSCHIQDENSGNWTFELAQIPAKMVGSTAITGDWANETYSASGSQHDFNNHLKMSPIASVCSSCHDAGYKTSDGRMNPDILDGGPYVGSHWWQMGGIAPGIVRPGNSPQSTKHQSGK